jgi:SNF2 family DNA or RNA helicase
MADDMGLGKTIQIITLLLHAKQEASHKCVPSLVVCPTTLIGNWEKECARFAPSLAVSIYQGHERRLELKQVDVILTSFGIFRRDLAKFSEKSWAFLIVDEAQNIKNSETAQTKAIKSLKAKHRIVMTGTPVENRLTELWNLFDFINPGYLGNLTQFKPNWPTLLKKRETPTLLKN